MPAVTLTTLNKWGTASPTTGAWTRIVLPTGTRAALIRVTSSSSVGAYVDGPGASYAQDASWSSGEGGTLGQGESWTVDMEDSSEAYTVYAAGISGTATVEVYPSSVRLSR